MNSVMDVGKLALRKLGVLARGKSPTDQDGRDILAAAQSFYDEIVSAVRLTPVFATGDMEAEEDTQVYSSGHAVTFPASVQDGGTRAPLDLAVISVVTAGQSPDTRIYDATRGEWVSVSGLALTDDAPLESRSVDGLASCWAKKLAEFDGIAVASETQLAAARFMALIRSARNRAAGPEYY